MKKVIVHPLTQLIIRENPLIGFEGEMNLDKLNKDLSYKTTKYRKDGASHEELLEDVKGNRGIPERGWIEMYITKDMKIEEIWKQAMQEI